jgi:hypothetical protein
MGINAQTTRLFSNFTLGFLKCRSNRMNGLSPQEVRRDRELADSVCNRGRPNAALKRNAFDDTGIDPIGIHRTRIVSIPAAAPSRRLEARRGDFDYEGLAGRLRSPTRHLRGPPPSQSCICRRYFDFREVSSCPITGAAPVCQRDEARALTAASRHPLRLPQFRAGKVSTTLKRVREVSPFGKHP